LVFIFNRRKQRERRSGPEELRVGELMVEGWAWCWVVLGAARETGGHEPPFAFDGADVCTGRWKRARRVEGGRVDG
jgi:hypothetical protein